MSAVNSLKKIGGGGGGESWISSDPKKIQGGHGMCPVLKTREKSGGG